MFDATVRVMFCCTKVAVTAACGTAAPVGSVTYPLIVPVTCARVSDAPSMNRTGRISPPHRVKSLLATSPSCSGPNPRPWAADLLGLVITRRKCGNDLYDRLPYSTTLVFQWGTF